MKKKLNCILLIDDDEPTNYLTQIFLEEYGCCHHIKAVQSGEEALQYLAKSAGEDSDGCPNPDLIFLDINMPAMNGWEFLDRYKEMNIGHENKTIVVMLTTSLFPEDKAKASNRPEVSGFEHKPLTIENLDKVLRKHFAAYI